MALPVEQHLATCECLFCRNSGSCAKCDGSGERERTVRGRFHKRVKLTVVCKACDGTGVCQLCLGSGYLVEAHP